MDLLTIDQSCPLKAPPCCPQQRPAHQMAPSISYTFYYSLIFKTLGLVNWYVKTLLSKEMENGS